LGGWEVYVKGSGLVDEVVGFDEEVL